MIRGLGNDIIEINRIRAGIDRHGHHFVNKLFTEHEQQYCTKYRDSAPHFAGRFAAKEAIAKALGVGLGEKLSWLEIEIRNNFEGKPFAILSPKVMATFHEPQLLIAISHCREYATATAIYTSDER
jgi:holo-[acyl-carrier protein] synthase